MAASGYRTPQAAGELLALRHHVFRDSAVVDELEDGYVLGYPEQPPWPHRLDEFERHASAQFPWLSIAVEQAQDAGLLILTVRGADGVKKWVQSERSARSGPRSVWRATLRRGWQRATSFARVLPDFLVIGVPRAGTSTMFDLLRQHPSIEPSAVKELAFFNVRYGKGELWYRSCFPLQTRRSFTRWRTGAFQTGEATPTYLFHPHAARRMRKTVPDAKLIVMLRNPVGRAYSHYHWSVRMELESLSFEEAIEREEERVAGELEKMLADEDYVSLPRGYLSYLGMGRYAEQLEAWFQVFPREQFLLLPLEEIARGSALERAFRFLGVRPHEPRYVRSANSGFYPKMRSATRARLSEYFRPHNERLWDLIGEDYGWNRQSQ